MNPDLRTAVESAIHTHTGTPAEIVSDEAVSGGCINDARRLELRDGRRFFVKSNPSPLPGLFEREAEGLAALAAADAVRVPRPIAAETAPTPFLVLEAIDSAPRQDNFDLALGRQLAMLHRNATGERFGFAHDNYLGSTPQPNPWTEDWVEFWRERRLGHLLKLLRDQDADDAELQQAGEKVLARLDRWLAEPAEPPCLLHGDLWRGNVMSGPEGEPVVLDPAVYYGRREAELAMPQLFGGFGEAFFHGYQEVWPLAPGAAERLELYKLYHLLNHLLIFGASYRASCLDILRRFS